MEHHNDMNECRYFRASVETYEAIRAQLDAAWGYPTPAGTQTCYPPASEAAKDSQGRAYLGVLSEWCDYEAVAAVLPSLIAAGAVEEISESEYLAVAAPPSEPY